MEPHGALWFLPLFFNRKSGCDFGKTWTFLLWIKAWWTLVFAAWGLSGFLGRVSSRTMKITFYGWLHLRAKLRCQKMPQQENITHQKWRTENSELLQCLVIFHWPLRQNNANKKKSCSITLRLRAKHFFLSSTVCVCLKCVWCLHITASW